MAQLEQTFPQIKRLRDSGAGRYETVLAAVGLQTTADRPIPDDLDRALAEFGALRDVLMHRAGRVDFKALEQAPTLQYDDGDLVRITRADYRTYSAAIRCYAQDVDRQSNDSGRGRRSACGELTRSASA